VNKVTVRAYGPHDIPAIAALERASAGAPQWGEAFWRREVPGDAPLREVFVAEIDDQLCGYVVACYAVGVAELESVAVSAIARRGGLGQTLCERAMQWARERGAKAMELEVRDSNAAALGLYQRMGFVEQGRRPLYYKDPVESAVLMTAKL
jgi:ribosomal-protein-alanine N-acetyltransferase